MHFVVPYSIVWALGTRWTVFVDKKYITTDNLYFIHIEVLTYVDILILDVTYENDNFLIFELKQQSNLIYDWIKLTVIFSDLAHTSRTSGWSRVYIGACHL